MHADFSDDYSQNSQPIPHSLSAKIRIPNLLIPRAHTMSKLDAQLTPATPTRIFSPKTEGYQPPARMIPFLQPRKIRNSKMRIPRAHVMRTLNMRTFPALPQKIRNFVRISPARTVSILVNTFKTSTVFRHNTRNYPKHLHLAEWFFAAKSNQRHHNFEVLFQRALAFSTVKMLFTNRNSL